jgi:hypothetical protein
MTNVTPIRAEVAEFINRVMRNRTDYIAMMAAAYLQKTNLDPEEVELIEERNLHQVRWYFRKRKGDSQNEREDLFDQR